MVNVNGSFMMTFEFSHRNVYDPNISDEKYEFAISFIKKKAKIALLGYENKKFPSLSDPKNFSSRL